MSIFDVPPQQTHFSEHGGALQVRTREGCCCFPLFLPENRFRNTFPGGGGGRDDDDDDDDDDDWEEVSRHSLLLLVVASGDAHPIAKVCHGVRCASFWRVPTRLPEPLRETV